MFTSIAASFWIYTLIVVLVGLYSARFSEKSESDFFLAGRGLGPWVAALSASASAESGWVTLGLVGMAYATGIGALWIVMGTVCAFIFNWFVLYCWDGLGAGFGPALILSLFWQRANGWGVASGMIVGVVTVIVWRQFPALQAQVYALIPAFAAATLSIVVVSLLTPVDRAADSPRSCSRVGVKSL